VEQPATAAVLIIGNEILSGRTQDVNLKHIAEHMGRWGIRMKEARVIPDIEEDIVDSLNQLRARYTYVFTTGGIGPTHDDITSECIAKAFDRPLVIHPEIAELIQSRPAPPEVMDSRMRMACVPEGATLVANPTGGPPGFCIENVYVMAGIPAVMQAMLGTLEPFLNRGEPVQSRSVTAFLGESQIAAALGELQARFHDIDLGSYPFFKENRYGTTLVMRGIDEARLQAMLEGVKNIIIEAGETPVNTE